MGKKTTKKETDFWGNEKEVHYEDGKKVGETKFWETFWGNKVQDHYDASGNKTGETRREKGFFGDKAVHYDSDENKVGYSKDDTTFFGDKIQRHYDTTGHQVGKTHYEEGFFGGHRKVHEGEYFKSGASEAESSSSYSGGGGGYSGGSSSSSSLGFGTFIFIIVYIGLGIGLISELNNSSRNSNPQKTKSPTPTPSSSTEVIENIRTPLLPPSPKKIDKAVQKEVILDKWGEYNFHLEPYQQLVIRYKLQPHPSGKNWTIITVPPHSNTKFLARCFKENEKIPVNIGFRQVEFLHRELDGDEVCIVKASSNPFILRVSF